MQIPWFSPRIYLIEMAPRPAPRSGYPSRPALPLPCPICHHRQIDRQTPLLLLYIRLKGSENKKKTYSKAYDLHTNAHFFQIKIFPFHSSKTMQRYIIENQPKYWGSSLMNEMSLRGKKNLKVIPTTQGLNPLSS